MLLLLKDNSFVYSLCFSSCGQYHGNSIKAVPTVGTVDSTRRSIHRGKCCVLRKTNWYEKLFVAIFMFTTVHMKIVYRARHA